MRMRPANNYVTIRPELETERSGIAIPDRYVEPAAPSGLDNRAHGADEEIALSSRTCVGVVVAVGPGAPELDYDGNWHQRVAPDDICAGDRVLFERTSSRYLPDDETVIVRYEAVWCVLDPSIDVQTTRV